jgi:chromate reductase, NAD(P)H dehydrogenase (quinone)
MNLIGVVGSLRVRSTNRAMAQASLDAVPSGTTLTLHDVADIALYNGDIEDAGLPASVTALHEAVATCDGLILFSPEYNGSLPAVTKNVIDWLSRPPRSWAGTPITMIALTPGPRAGLGVREHFSSIMARQPTRLFETFGVGSSFDKLDSEGKVIDAETLDELSSFLGRFADFCATIVDDA